MVTIKRADIIDWAQIVAQLIQIGAATIPQVLALIKAAQDQQSDVQHALEDAALSAETHAILAQIKAQAQV